MNTPFYTKPTESDLRDRWSWQLGRFFGIPTRIHFSFVLVLLWVGFSTWTSAQSGAAVLFGLLFAAAVFACVLAHEFGHALVARRFGVGTRRITLHPLGGLAELERLPPNPRAELWIALAGPAVNLVIAAALAVVVVTSGLFGGPGLLAMVLAGLMWANLMLALFNLIPAFPMDGGRVFRAWAERKHGRLVATTKAAKLGRWIALGFGAWGIVSGNWLLVLVAVFVYFAAKRELWQVQQLAAYEQARMNQAHMNQAQWLGGAGMPGFPRGSADEWPGAGRPRAQPWIDVDAAWTESPRSEPNTSSRVFVIRR